MEAAKKGQVARSAAEIYDEFFVPALFGEWAGPVAAAARLRQGDKVLDVACGTGVLAREAWKRVQPGGSVTGLDCNDGMLSAARRSSAEIDWRHGFAENLPFDDCSHGAVVSQFGLMFFEDRVTALREMARVLMPQGRLCVAVWDSVETSPGYAAMIELIDRLFGAEVADALRAPFVLGNKVGLSQLFADAGIDGASIVTRQGEARFPSIPASANSCDNPTL